MKYTREVIILVLAVIVICLLWNRYGLLEAVRNRDNIIKAGNDTLHSYTDKFNRQTAYIKAIEVTSIEQAVQMDNRFKQLREYIDKSVKNLTRITTTTSDTFNSVTNNYYYEKGDTAKKWPVYETEQKDKWSFFKITASKDKFTVKYDVTNEYVYTLKYKREKWYYLRRNIAVAEVKNLNPNTKTNELISFTQTYKLTKKEKLLSLSQKLLIFAGGIAVGFFVSK